jgi:diguanylate cyclase (GGDEF)-like protein
MTTDSSPLPPENYNGRILTGNYSDTLKKRVSELISSSRSIEQNDSPVSHYLAAWHENENVIWYEYVPHKVAALLGCQDDDVAVAFRNAVLDRRVYRYVDFHESKIAEEVLNRQQLSGLRQDLREEGKEKGRVEAVYKIILPENRTAWLKDQARVENYSNDKVCLSFGCLTDVSKEMEQKDLLERIGYFDQLTRLPNRAIMDRLMDVKIGEFERGYTKDFSLLMIDADYFKSVNDTYGHLAGDFVLQSMAEIMSATKRKEDEIGRYGGEEFYGLCQGSGKSVRLFAERLRKAISSHKYTYKNQDIKVTVSIGIASAREVEKISKESLIQMADKRLYKAKEKGRNQVVTAS